ncbi:hypothetical protein [Zwartia vadi]|uniref:hypothetical protein n=1 Tax=Zwartia vadi TaxID=3058168 RepID=UPI0025B2CBF0|nr:hypothetical protein [Zwartia vadi]MDN3987221.1 hypothetical protein [Zwartia vadi]
MKKLVLALFASLLIVPAYAQTSASGCEAKAVSKDGKPLAGAAKTSFMQKCERESGVSSKAAACEAKALSKDGKPLYGAAKDASIKKCVADAK